MTAVICVMGPFAVPIGPVPISLTNLALYITVYVLGTKRSVIACLLYLFIGLVGVPVFSGFTGGPQKLAGPTGGYLVGFIFMTLVAGLIIDRAWNNRIVSAVGLFLATCIPYIIGTAWLAYSAHMTFRAALAVGVLPFLIGDVLKIIGSVAIGPQLKKRLSPFLGYSEA